MKINTLLHCDSELSLYSVKSYFCVSMHFFILEPQFATPIKFLRCHMTCCVYHITHQCIITTRQSDCNLVGQIMILFLLLSLQCIPPFPKDLANWSVVLVRMSLVHKSTMTFTEYHKCVHWSPHMVTQTIFHLEPTNSSLTVSELHSSMTPAVLYWKIENDSVWEAHLDLVYS